MTEPRSVVDALTGAVRIRVVDAIAIQFGRTNTADGSQTKRAASEVEAERLVAAKHAGKTGRLVSGR